MSELFVYVETLNTFSDRFSGISSVSFGSVCWSWVVGPKSWVVGSKLWVVGPKSQGVGRGFQVVGRGSWVIDWKGSALAQRRFFGIPSISKQTLSSL